MRRLPILSFLLIIFLLGFSPVLAQEFDFNKAYQDYQYNYNLYRSSHIDYIAARSEYLNYRTLTSQTKAIEKTKEMLLNRAETLKTYLTALRIKLRETTGITNYDQNISYLKLDNKVTFISSHKNSLPSAASLEDLVKISTELEKAYPEIEVLSYQTLGKIIIGKESYLRQKINEQIQMLEEKINEIRNEGEDTTIPERWLIQTKEKIKRSEEKEKEAQTVLDRISTGDANKIFSWNKAQKLFEEENQYLKEAISSIKEIIREIKND
jgi:hypothetical protein